MRMLVAVGVLVVGAVLFFTFFNKNTGPDPRYVERVEDAQRFLAENRGRIEAVVDKLERVAAIDVERAQVEAEGSKPVEPGLYLWHEDLVRAEKQRFKHAYGPLAVVREMHRTLGQENAGVDSLGAPEDLERQLQQMETAAWGLIQIQLIQPPEITSLATPEQRGTFTPGSVYFQLLVVDPASGKVLAKGRGQATNSPAVEVRASPDLLLDDLKSETAKAATGLAKELLGS